MEDTPNPFLDSIQSGLSMLKTDNPQKPTSPVGFKPLSDPLGTLKSDLPNDPVANIMPKLTNGLKLYPNNK